MVQHRGRFTLPPANEQVSSRSTGGQSGAHTNADSTHIAVRAEVARLTTQSVANKTLRAYEQAQGICFYFRRALGYGEEDESRAAQVAEFIAWLSLQGKAASTISSYVAGDGFWYKINLLLDPTDNFMVKKLLTRCAGDEWKPMPGNLSLAAFYAV
jgi:hypothetical protein